MKLKFNHQATTIFSFPLFVSIIVKIGKVSDIKIKSLIDMSFSMVL